MKGIPQRVDTWKMCFANTSVVAVSSVQYATGTVVDISRLRQSTIQVGARLIVDATVAQPLNRGFPHRGSFFGTYYKYSSTCALKKLTALC
jgi:cystathionine beta-lyase/cystathionine gamma-synthase